MIINAYCSNCGNWQLVDTAAGYKCRACLEWQGEQEKQATLFAEERRPAPCRCCGQPLPLDAQYGRACLLS